MNIKKIQKQLSDFADERDWNQFHNPKNLSMALSVEASELVEIFQWLTPEQAEAIMSTDEGEHVKEQRELLWQWIQLLVSLKSY